MADDSSPRQFSEVDLKRTIIGLVITAVVGISYWMMLPAIQSVFVPTAVGGDTGPWVIRPVTANRFCATAIMTVPTILLILWPLQQVWRREDAEEGTHYSPLQGRPALRTLVVLKGLLLALVYASGLVFHLLSWTVIGPDGIEERVPWSSTKHSYAEIVWLEMIPDGFRSDSLTQNGPWYSIKMKNGHSIALSTDNEGTSGDELRAIAAYVDDRSAASWTRRGDARKR